MKFVVRMVALFAMCITCVQADTWTLSSGVTITKSSGSIEGNRNPSISVRFEAKEIVVNLTDFFYSEGSFTNPWISIVKDKKATLHIGTKKASGLFSSKDEFLREVIITVSYSRVPQGTTLYILNDDTGEVLGHAVVH